MKYVLMFLLMAGMNVAQAKNIKFQITPKDASMNELFQRWAGESGYKVHWNALEQLNIDHKSKDLENINKVLSRQKEFKSAVLLALQVPENAPREYDPSPLGMCVFSKKTIAIYSTTQTNCGIKQKDENKTK